VNGKPLGDRGEAIAAVFLERAGWEIVHRNFRIGRKEIDLVARRDGVVAFVEVKTRAGPGFGHPLEAVTLRKRREVQQVAQSWLTLHGRPDDVYRFDAIGVRIARAATPIVEHVEDAWRT
jgi:putative endonuclease